ncbi:unnamed protein product [Sphagnum jensenii]|uniref:enoyl-[acyl-carrier-protein] reductase n=1 Tax=Sphagnum jensenii TaxID=128206 RepID=A0ABP0W7W4_9BRYO
MAMLMRSLLPRVGILSPPVGCPRLIRCLSSAAVCPPARAAVYHQHGAPDHVLQLVEVEGRELLEGEVCVKMLAAPINPSDINRIEGVYPMRPPVPAVGGTEGVGVVVSVAPGVSKLKVNDWVIPSHPHIGTWRTYIAKEESAWCLVAKDVPEKYAATVSVNPCTALRMLQDIVDLKPGASVVQNGATSMVGQCVIQLARLNDLQTINLIRDRPDLDSVKERLKALGADYVLTEEELGSIDKKTLAGRAQAKLGLNCVGGSAATAVMKLLGEGGVMVTYGGMAKKPITLSTGPLIFKDLRLQGFWLGKWKSNHSDEEFSTMVNYLLRLVRDGKLQYAMDEVQFSDFDTALQKALGQQGSALKQVLIFN